MGWDGIVIIGQRSSKSTLGANNLNECSYIRRLFIIVKTAIDFPSLQYFPLFPTSVLNLVTRFEGTNN